MEALRVLAEHGAHLDMPLDDGATAAIVAAQNGHADVVRVLAQRGANGETPGTEGVTPAYIAVENGHVGVVKLLAEFGANLDTPEMYYGHTPNLVATHSDSL